MRTSATTCARELRRLQRRLGITVLLVTHDQVEALSVSDRIAVMRAGHIDQIGRPEDIYGSPISAAVRDFVGRAVVLEGAVAEVPDLETVVSLTGGGQLICRGMLPEGVHVGDQCQVGLRPEHIHIGGPDETDLPGQLDKIVWRVGLPRCCLSGTATKPGSRSTLARRCLRTCRRRATGRRSSG